MQTNTTPQCNFSEHWPYFGNLLVAMEMVMQQGKKKFFVSIADYISLFCISFFIISNFIFTNNRKLQKQGER